MPGETVLRLPVVRTAGGGAGLCPRRWTGMDEPGRRQPCHPHGRLSGGGRRTEKRTKDGGRLSALRCSRPGRSGARARASDVGGTCGVALRHPEARWLQGPAVTHCWGPALRALPRPHGGPGGPGRRRLLTPGPCSFRGRPSARPPARPLSRGTGHACAVRPPPGPHALHGGGALAAADPSRPSLAGAVAAAPSVVGPAAASRSRLSIGVAPVRVASPPSRAPSSRSGVLPLRGRRPGGPGGSSGTPAPRGPPRLPTWETPPQGESSAGPCGRQRARLPTATQRGRA